MTAQIGRELFQMFIMFYCGMAVMFIFSVRDLLVKRAGRKSRGGKCIYLCGWLCAGFLFSQFLYQGSHGVITLYGILSMTAGILLWKKYIYGIIFP